jgi:protein SCO1
MLKRIRPTRLALTLAATLGIGLTLAGCSGGSSSTPASSAISASGFEGAALPAGAPARDFTLTDLPGHRVMLSSYRGQVTILAFLYSSCGATCVLIAQQVRGALDELAHHTPVLFVSVDPGGDTPARVGRFLTQVSLGGRVRYLTGPRAALQRVWRAFGAVPASRGGAAFDRSASVIVLDRGGRERVIFGLEQLTAEGLAHDVRKLS